MCINLPVALFYTFYDVLVRPVPIWTFSVRHDLPTNYAHWPNVAGRSEFPESDGFWRSPSDWNLTTLWKKCVKLFSSLTTAADLVGILLNCLGGRFLKKKSWKKCLKKTISKKNFDLVNKGLLSSIIVERLMISTYYWIHLEEMP